MVLQSARCFGSSCWWRPLHAHYRRRPGTPSPRMFRTPQPYLKCEARRRGLPPPRVHSWQQPDFSIGTCRWNIQLSNLSHGSLADDCPLEPSQTAPRSSCRYPLVVCSFGRSGTHLMIDIIRRQFAAFDAWKLPGERPSALYVSLDAVVRRGDARARLQQSMRRPQRPIVKCHDWPHALGHLEGDAPDIASWLADRASAIVILRDPAVAISRLWSASVSHLSIAPAVLDAQLDAFVVNQSTRWRDHVDAIEHAMRRLGYELPSG